jgi:hypothetical protein
MEAISRRRLWSLVTLAAGLGVARAARAELPDCSRSGDYGDFDIMAYIDEKGALSYLARLANMRANAPTRSGSVSVAPLTYVAGDSLDISFMVASGDEDDDFAEDAVGIYEIFSGDTRIAAVSFSPQRGFADIGNQRVVAQRMLQTDSVIRVTLGESVTQWPVSAAQLGGALDRAAALGRALQNDYVNGRCKGASGDCLMTTVACRTLGLDDDCFELRSVRRLRDGWLMHQPGGAAEIAWYCRIAPALLAAIPAARRGRLFRGFYLVRLVPAVLLERLGCHRWAFRWLKQGVLRLARRYRPEGEGIAESR